MTKRSRKNPGDEFKGLDVVNTSDADRGGLFLMHFGAYGDTKLLVWADHFEDAFEYAVDHLDDPKTCGIFSVISDADMKAAAKDEGIEWPAGGWDELSEAKQNKVYDAATVDMTIIGHTTIRCVKEPGIVCIPSWEWGGTEIHGEAKQRMRAETLAVEEAPELERLGWGRLKAKPGVWTKPLGTEKPCDAVLYDQAAVFAESGGHGRNVRVEIENLGETIRKGTFDGVSNADDWTTTQEDELVDQEMDESEE